MPTARTERRVLGGAAKRIRELQGIQLDPIAKEVGISVSYLCNIEAGRKTPTFPKMIALATALGCDLADITYTTQMLVMEDEAA